MFKISRFELSIVFLPNILRNDQRTEEFVGAIEKFEKTWEGGKPKSFSLGSGFADKIFTGEPTGVNSAWALREGV